MHSYKTEAIVLDSSEIFDTDRSLLLFTYELGKIRARARGVRKPTSRLAGHLLPCLPTFIELAETNGNYLITSALISGQDAAAYPSDALLFQRQAGIIAETVNRLFVDGEAHPEIFDGLMYTMDRLRALCGNSDEPRARLVATEFVVKALAELGYRPQLQQDVVSGQPVGADFLAWSSLLGGIMGEETYRNHSGQGLRITYVQSVVALRQLLRPQFVAERIGMPDEVLNEVCALAYDYLQTVVGQPLRSLA